MIRFKRRNSICCIVMSAVIFLTACSSGSGGGVNASNDGYLSTVTENNRQEESSRGQVALTLGTTESPWEITRAVEAYNAKNGKYYVEIVDYSEKYPDYDTAQERLKLDLGTSKGPDLIWVGDLVADELGYAGALKDLNVYLTPEKREKYLTNILECAQTGDALYEMAATFELGFLAGNKEKIGSENGWTMDEMLELFRKNDMDVNGIGGLGVYSAQELVLHSIDDFVDWDNGKVDFCNQEFYDILEFCRNEKGWVKATPESVASGTHPVVCAGLSDVSNIQYMNWLLGDHWVVKGWPGKQGTGVKVSFYNSFAVSACSNCPEGVWDFLEYYMTLDWLEDYAVLHPDIPAKTYQSIHGLPLNRNTFDKLLEWSTEQRLLDTGEPVPLYFGEGEIPDFYANSKEDAEKIREIAALADGRSVSIHSFVSQIIGEEISGYKTGGVSAEQTAKIIQNRIQLYLDEQKR